MIVTDWVNSTDDVIDDIDVTSIVIDVPTLQFPLFAWNQSVS